MLKSLRKSNKNVFVYPPPLSYQGRGSRGMCADREGGELRGGICMCARTNGLSHVRGCVLTYKERGFRGGGLESSSSR